MSDIFGSKKGQPFIWYNKNLARSNQYCLYCGEYIGVESAIASDKEHLVGRNFVPTGTLDSDCFNFIFRACRECNGRKSVAERHISSVTLFNSPSRWSDNKIDALALHKASRDYHPDKKGVLVKDASDRHNVELRAVGVKADIQLIGPPQLNNAEVEFLACKHLQAIFALLTTEDPRVGEKSKILPADHVLYYGHYHFRDWGNPHLKEISLRSADWEALANVVTADGYFKLLIKANASKAGTGELFWAIEWNKYLRIIGAICLPSVDPDLFSNLPELGWRIFSDGSRSRREIPLREEDDILFPTLN